MSDQIIVPTFKSTDDAYDAAGAMKQLKNQGAVDLKVKAGILIKKDDRETSHCWKARSGLRGARRLVPRPAH